MVTDVSMKVEMAPEEIPLTDGHARLWRGWIPSAEARCLFERLAGALAWQQPVIRTFGREHPIPRLNAWYGDPGAAYTYSGTTFKPLPWTPALLDIKRRVEMTAGAPFNSVLANYYRGGRDSVAWHSDAERELGPNPVIASVSLGAERKFTMKHKRCKSIPRVDIQLSSGSLLVMDGPTQHNWVHQVPKTAKRVGGRINLTFRLIR